MSQTMCLIWGSRGERGSSNGWSYHFCNQVEPVQDSPPLNYIAWKGSDKHQIHLSWGANPGTMCSPFLSLLWVHSLLCMA